MCFTLKFGTTGIAKAIDINREFSIFVSVALLSPNGNRIIPEYLEKVLNSPICRAQAKALTQGVGNQNLVIKDLKQIEFPLPSLDDQKSIAAKIQELMQEIERARTACEKQLLRQPKSFRLPTCEKSLKVRRQRSGRGRSYGRCVR